MTRQALLRTAQAAGHPHAAAQAVLAALFGRPIYDASCSWQDYVPGVLAHFLAQGARVSLRGYFALETRPRRPTTRRNPRTGEAVAVGGHVTAWVVFPAGFLRRQQKPLGRVDTDDKKARQ